MALDTPTPDKNERLARLALYLGLNFNAGAFHRVMRQAGSAETAFQGLDFSHLGVNLPTLLSGGLFEEAQDRLAQGEKSGLDILIWGDDDYPVRLDEIVDPPPVLWVRGKIEAADSLAVGLVGSRKASAYGLKAARRFSFEGGSMGLAIVSGLAKGIDAEAHWGALEAGGRTLAVLGNGLDWVYPKENARLYELIPTQGALISEFPPETRPHPANFPRRNRVIAGLSLAVVVLEAGERSGALITARLALEQGREVMALPGPAGADWAKGANKLIKSGAALVENMAEVLAEIKPRLLEGLKPPAAGAGVIEAPPIETAAVRQSVAAPAAKKVPAAPAKPSPAAAEPAPKAAAIPPDPPGSPEGKIMNALAGRDLDAENLVQATGLGVSELAFILLNLELAGRINRLDNGLYSAAISKQG